MYHVHNFLNKYSEFTRFPGYLHLHNFVTFLTDKKLESVNHSGIFSPNVQGGMQINVTCDV